ncbi:MAG TPA: hypothetical protein VFV87_20895 [Pirellulaceae bacterium]|nr:hypothetical protein [Pirellulaceae bacterium]
MRALIFCILFVACSFGRQTARAEENSLADAHRAFDQYLHEIDQIERQAAQSKAEARARLLDALGLKGAFPPAQAQKATPGLIGTAIVDGRPSGVAFHYEHGKLFPRELVWDRFHKQVDGQTYFPDLNITLVGHVEVPHEMTAKVSQAAGGVNSDHGTLFIDDRQIGQVGDDTAKAEIYLLTLSAGIHSVRWVLTAGTFQNSQLKFEDPRTGELLKVFYDEVQRRETGAADAREWVEAAADPSEWVKAMGPNHWRWVPLAK